MARVSKNRLAPMLAMKVKLVKKLTLVVRVRLVVKGEDSCEGGITSGAGDWGVQSALSPSLDAVVTLRAGQPALVATVTE
jgi:hypothetical protein